MLKHGDRHDVVRPAAKWMARAAQTLLRPDTLIAPIPLHWGRMLSRRFNQSALLAQALARETGLPCCPDLLTRLKRTQSLKGLSVEARHATLMDAIRVTPRHRGLIAGRPILIVDDVMTSGATLSVAAQACFSAGSGDVSVVTLARAAKDA
jgi:predicted amidophosphoribosyltransferase